MGVGTIHGKGTIALPRSVVVGKSLTIGTRLQPSNRNHRGLLYFHI